MADSQEQLEMAMLDKEMAEERAEAAEADLEEVKEQLAMVEVELQHMKEGGGMFLLNHAAGLELTFERRCRGRA